MSEDNAETIHVADVSDGVGGDAESEPGDPVELPVVDVLTGRSFITGKSGSGKSNTASVLIENLLEDNYPVLIVDSDGEYYGLKEEYEILHVGADDECDIVVSPEHAEKIATLALDQNVPIILDVSGYLEESVASELILNVVKHLFAKEKKLKRPFLLVIEECHEYIPEGGGMDETGKMLIKVGKRGRKHGLGIVGISQRPADVKKDFITQCDWLVWHRLTWDNDTNVVSRILGSEYADAIEDMGDGEAFLMSDWDESIRRIQFHRKQTFDAGATPGLEDFERPELKSVSGDLVSELETISDEQAQRESELADLRQELEKKRARINQLEQELEEARDLSRMADRFSQALLRRSEASYRGGAGRDRAADGGADENGGTTDANADREDQSTLEDHERRPGAEERSDGDGGDGGRNVDGEGDGRNVDGEDGMEADDDPGNTATEPAAATTADDDVVDSIEWIEEPEAVAGDGDLADVLDDATADAADGDVPGIDDLDPIAAADVAESALRFDEAIDLGTREAVVENLRDRVDALSEISTAMLCHYRREGTSDPVTAHIAAGGDGDTEHAYARHRPLRRSGLVRHVDGSRYEYGIPWLVREAYADRLEEDAVAGMVAAVEDAFVPPAERGSEATDGPISTPVPEEADAAAASRIEASRIDAELESESPTTNAVDAPDADEPDSEEVATSIATPGLSETARSIAADSGANGDADETAEVAAGADEPVDAHATTDGDADVDESEAAGAGLEEDAEVLSDPDDAEPSEGDGAAGDDAADESDDFDPAADDAEIVDPEE
ncbi:helicase HerA domain-containing protein [Halopenitus persicus]|uniref:Uncharacterized protein n=1 Tax=Halopenitus persicus TaxID=1048396 RepID=A0A1H3HNS7_9EURY|nr:DUF87 domain-containing protein [Halopenitus persicus]SDY16329.1 protein of unknown function DUF87 [Halopenitus persicus]